MAWENVLKVEDWVNEKIKEAKEKLKRTKDPVEREMLKNRIKELSGW